MARIATLGSALQDIYLLDRDDFAPSMLNSQTVFGQIAIGSKVDIDQVFFSIGGGGTNAATSFARHGHQTIFLGAVGRDPAGEAVSRLLDEEGIDSSYLNVLARRQTGVSVILLDLKTGERTILSHRGTSARYDYLDPNDLELIQPDWLYVTTLRGDFRTLENFFKVAKALKIKIMFNPGKLELDSPSRLLKLISDYVDILLLNQVEASKLVKGENLIELITRLKTYAPAVIITAGSMGAIATNGQKTYRIGLYEDLRVRDTNGAGDAFGSGFLAHLTAGHSFRSSLIFASANSTSVVSRIGAKTGILTGSEPLHSMPLQSLSL